MQDEKEWNSLLLLWSTPKKDLLWLFEGPETNSLLYQVWWHVWESHECQCMVLNMSDRPYKQVLSHPMQLKFLLFFMDVNKECLTVAMWGPRDKFFHIRRVGACVWVLGCQCLVAYMTDSPYRLVFIRLMQDEKEWNSLLLLWSTPKKDLRWLFEGPETNSFIYQGWWHVWESLECQCSMANMSDRPYRQVLSHPMQLKLLIVFMDDSK